MKWDVKLAAKVRSLQNDPKKSSTGPFRAISGGKTTRPRMLLFGRFSSEKRFF
jgi:hypothetical protein